MQLPVVCGNSLNELALKLLFIKCFLIIMVFLLLNQSIGTIDFMPIRTANGINDFNDINSGSEYISEVVFGIINCFPEFQKKNTSKQSQTAKHVFIKSLQPLATDILIKSYTSTIIFTYPTDEKHNFLFSKDITPQPPKA